MQRLPLVLLASILSAVCSLGCSPEARRPSEARTSSPGAYAGYSTAAYDGYERVSQYITMKDGTRLAADILRPTKGGVVAEEKLPVVWTHHRYNRAFMRGDTIVDYAAGFGRGIE